MKVKHFGFAALALAFLATSCAKETVEVAGGNDGKISFKTALGKQSRAAEFTYWTSAAGYNKLNVWGYATGGTEVVFDNTELTFDGSAWSYTTPVDQPGYSVTYYSVYAADVDGKGVTPPAYVTKDGTGATFEYTVKPTPATSAGPDTQEDLIAATISTPLAAVPLQFNHLLSQVNFAIQGVKNVQVKITNLKVKDVKSKATYTFGSTTGWGTRTLNANYDYYPLTGSNITDGLATTIQPMGNYGGPLSSANKNALMLMPQTFAVAGDGNFSFDYELYAFGATIGTDDALATGSTTANLNDFTIATWDMSKRYVYVIDFTDYFKSGKIAFTVTVNPWTDAEETDNSINQTLTVANATAASIEGAITTLNTAKLANGNLTVFPISLPAVGVDKATAITLLGTSDFYAFNAGDEIRINCQNANTTIVETIPAGFTNYWTIEKSGFVYTLTRTATLFGAAAAVEADGTVDNTIADAIAAQNTAKTALLKAFPITVTEDLSAEEDPIVLDLSAATNFKAGDRLVFTFNDADQAELLEAAPAGWALSVKGAVVTIIMK